MNKAHTDDTFSRTNVCSEGKSMSHPSVYSLPFPPWWKLVHGNQFASTEIADSSGEWWCQNTS